MNRWPKWPALKLPDIQSRFLSGSYHQSVLANGFWYLYLNSYKALFLDLISLLPSSESLGWSNLGWCCGAATRCTNGAWSGWNLVLSWDVFAGIFKPQALSSCLEKRFGIQSNTPETNIRMWYPRRMVRWLLPRRDVMRKIIYIYIFVIWEIDSMII